jgi:hypothetical protein
LLYRLQQVQVSYKASDLNFGNIRYELPQKNWLLLLYYSWGLILNATDKKAQIRTATPVTGAKEAYNEYEARCLQNIQFNCCKFSKTGLQTERPLELIELKIALVKVMIDFLV